MYIYLCGYPRLQLLLGFGCISVKELLAYSSELLFFASLLITKITNIQANHYSLNNQEKVVTLWIFRQGLSLDELDGVIHL